MKGYINVKKLESDARKSCCKESFIVLERNPIIRIGAGARAGDGDVFLLFIDISLKLCPGKSLSNTVGLEKGVQLTRSLCEIGYDITCDEGEINFEKTVSGPDMNREYELVLGIIETNGLLDLNRAPVSNGVPA